eukprot:242003-Amphidinium_carterae.1
MESPYTTQHEILPQAVAMFAQAWSAFRPFASLRDLAIIMASSTHSTQQVVVQDATAVAKQIVEPSGR